MIQVTAYVLASMVVIGVVILALRGLLWLIGWVVALSLVAYTVIRCYLNYGSEWRSHV